MPTQVLIRTLSESECLELFGDESKPTITKHEDGILVISDDKDALQRLADKDWETYVAKNPPKPIEPIETPKSRRGAKP